MLARAALPALLLTLTSLAACSSDSLRPAAGNGTTAGNTTSGTTLEPTPCAAGEGDPGRTVVVHSDDLVGGFGSFGTRTPNHLTAGLVRIAVTTEPDNAAPVDVVVSMNGVTVAQINGVVPGVTCGVEVGLAPGHYVVTSGEQEAGFDVEAA